MRASFRDEYIFRIRRWLQQLFNAGKRTSGGCDAGVNGIAGAFEIIPREVLHVGPKHKVCVPLPRLELMLLGCRDRARDNLKNVLRSAPVAILDAHRDGKHAFGAQLSRSDRRDLRDEAAVSEATGSYFDGFEKPRKGATRANGIYQTALREDNWIARREIGRDDGHWNPQVFELLCLKNAVHQIGQSMIACQAKAGNAPTSDVAKFQVAASCQNLRQRRAARIGCTENAANARPSDVGDGDVILLKDLQHAKVRKSPRKPTAKGDTDTTLRGCGTRC